MSDAPPPTPKGGKTAVKLHIPDDVAGGQYSNLQIIAASETEFILDFGFVQPQEPKGRVHSRVIVSPRHAKQLMRMLAERIRVHEQRFGEIPMPGPPGAGGGLVN